jgi:hypothetical protein
MKSRQERQKIMVRARMREGLHWHDICILNISSHGLGLQTAAAPKRGSYVEVCRGSHTIVARVAWSKGHRAGLRAQDAICIPAFITDNGSSSPRPTLGGQAVERRRIPRSTAASHERSRFMSRSIEFTCIALIAGAFAITIFGTIEQALARPLSQLRKAL